MSKIFNFRIVVILILPNLMVEAWTPSCPTAQPGLGSAVVEIGHECRSEDTCEGGGRCMVRCCHPNLANLDNVMLCDLEGWIRQCNSGYEVEEVKDLWSMRCTRASWLPGIIFIKGIKISPKKYFTHSCSEG